MHSNYLHVDFNEIPIKSTDVLRWQDGRRWMVVLNGEEVEFQPLYHTDCISHTDYICIPNEYEEDAAETKQDDDCDANYLRLITNKSIDKDIAKLKPVVSEILRECLKYANKQQSKCEVSIDLGGRNALSNKKASRIEQLLKDKGLDVHWHYGDGNYFKEDFHVFAIEWGDSEKSR